MSKEDLKARILAYVRASSDPVTFVELHRAIPEVTEPEWRLETCYGMRPLCADSNENIFIWIGMNDEAGEAVVELLAEGKLVYSLCAAKRYSEAATPDVKRLIPNLPIYSAEKEEELSRPHWCPVELRAA